jgi:Kef-type K+ transport system membrane component KefB
VLAPLLPHIFAHVAVPFDQWEALPKAQQALTPIADCAKQMGAAAKQCAQMAPKPESIAPTETIAYVLADLAIILIAARIVGAVFVRLKQPRVVGEIIAGILIGPTLLGGHLGRADITATPGSEAIVGHGLTNDLYPLQAFSFLNLIGQLTLVFFMFLVGLEVQQRFFKGRGRQIVIVALAVLLVPVALGFLVAAILSSATWKPGGLSDTTYGLVLGAAIAVTAFPVMARILQEKRMLATDMGSIGVGAAALVTPLMFLVVAAAQASAKDVSGAPNTVAVKLGLAIALVALLFAVVRPLLARFVLPRFDPDKPLSGDMLALLLIGALATGLAADRIGINSLNGGFLFGACVPQVRGIAKAVLDRMSDFVVVFMIPVFLAVAGLQTDFRVLTVSAIPGILLFVAAMIAGKWLVGAGAGRAVGMNWRESNAIGVLMNCRGLMILVVAIAAGSFNGITPTMRVTFALGAIITTVMTGPLFDAFVPKAEVEEEREKSIAGSLAGIPAMTGGPRVVVVPGDVSDVIAATNAAESFLRGDGPPAQFLVVTLVGTRRFGDYVGALAEDEGLDVDATRGWLEAAAARLRAEGADAQAVTFQSPDPRGDLTLLATDWAATDGVAVRESDAAALEAAGLAVTRVQPTPRTASGVLVLGGAEG